ncbi:MAG: hypothetical protein M3Z66_18610 [Chloroflexota bacterium]|nr:hypothetical protein [Chloroflexota bacterium]
MNEKQRSEEYYSELSVHESKGDANEANAEGMIYPKGEPIESTGKYADTPEHAEQE